jgi:hypothetical protein
MGLDMGLVKQFVYLAGICKRVKLQIGRYNHKNLAFLKTCDILPQSQLDHFFRYHAYITGLSRIQKRYKFYLFILSNCAF